MVLLVNGQCLGVMLVMLMMMMSVMKILVMKMTLMAMAESGCCTDSSISARRIVTSWIYVYHHHPAQDDDHHHPAQDDVCHHHPAQDVMKDID